MKRIFTGLIFGLLLVGTLLLKNVSALFFDIFLGTAILFANYEICSALNKRNKKTIKYISLTHAVLMYILLLLSAKLEYSLLSTILCQVYLLLSVLCISIIIEFICLKINNKKKTSKNKISNKVLIYNSIKTALNTLLTCVYPNLILGLMFIINRLAEFKFFNDENGLNLGFIILSLIFGISFITDIFAYVVGSIFGGPKLCPLISPKKTISGAIGGLIFAVIFSMAGYYVFMSIPAYNDILINKNITILTFIILAIIGSVASQCGDIFASLIKRKSNIKDFGSILPGHGGVLDRFDGVIFNTIIIFAYSCIFLI